MEPRFKAFIDWKRCQHCLHLSGHGVLRLFELPLGDLADDGMPVKGYVWIVNVTDCFDRFHIEGTMNVPPKGALRELFRLGRELGASRLSWDRVTEHGTRPFELNI